VAGVGLCPWQEKAWTLYRSGRSFVALVGPYAGKALFASVVVQASLTAGDEFADVRGPTTLIIASAASYEKLLHVRSLAQHTASQRVVLACADALVDQSWQSEQLDAVTTVLVVGQAGMVSVDAIAHVFSRLSYVPQVVVLLDAYDKDLLVRDSRSTDGEMFSFYDQGGAARLPLIRVVVSEPFRVVVNESGGHAILAVRVKQESSKLAAAKRMLRELFTSVAIVIVTQTYRKAERLAEALDRFAPGFCCLPAIHRDPHEFADAVRNLSVAVHRRDYGDEGISTDTRLWTRAAVVTDAASLKKIPLLNRVCLVVFFDAPNPAPMQAAGQIGAALRTFVAPTSSATLQAKVSMFPDVPITAVMTVSGPEARREGGTGFVELFFE
jgi:hypothetical protein